MSTRLRTTVVCWLLGVCFGTLSGCVTPTPTSAANPLRFSLLPPVVDIETLVPPADKNEPPVNGDRFDDVPIDGGTLCDEGKPSTCLKLKPGFVVDETTYARNLWNEITLKRLKVENAVLLNLRKQEWNLISDAEKAYQDRIAGLEKENADLRRPNILNDVKLFGAFTLGAALATIVAYGAASAAAR